MKKLPLIISRILDPLAFILIIIYLGAKFLSPAKLILSLLPSVITLLLFIAYFLYTLIKGETSNYDVTNRKERKRLYAVGLPLSLALVFYYTKVGELLLAHYILAFVILGAVFALITQKWKISFHVGIQGYFVAVVSFFYGGAGDWFIANILLICWARVKGKYHTLAQAVAGGSLGLVLGKILLKALLTYDLWPQI